MRTLHESEGAQPDTQQPKYELPSTAALPSTASVDEILRDSTVLQEVHFVQGVGAREYAGALLMNLFAGPVLSVLVIWAKHKALTDVMARAEAETTVEQHSTMRRRLVALEKSQM